jgi:ribosomal protein S12 methylthiotransferase accessory factor
MSLAGITRIADVTGLDRIGIPVVMIVRPNSRSISVAQGKGTCLVEAKVSGLMEAMESFHAERIYQPVTLCRYTDLIGSERVVDPAELPATQSSLFHVNLPIPWVRGTDLVEGGSILVPLEVVHTNFTVPRLPGSGCFLSNTNGLGSGNSYLEAVNHAICELIERDALAVWYASGKSSGAPIDLSTVSDPVILALLARIERAGCTLIVREITSDIGVPVFVSQLSEACESSRANIPATSGSGCHPDRSTACSRAIMEAVQSRLTRIAGSRDDLTPRWFQLVRRAEGNHQDTTDHASWKRFDDVSSLWHDTLEGDLRFLVQSLGRTGLKQVIAVDLTKPGIGIPVVRVIIPGLEGSPHQAGYVSGRRVERAYAG